MKVTSEVRVERCGNTVYVDFRRTKVTKTGKRTVKCESTTYNHCSVKAARVLIKQLQEVCDED